MFYSKNIKKSIYRKNNLYNHYNNSMKIPYYYNNIDNYIKTFKNNYENSYFRA